mmetsp:Transcript_21744/g.53225  ORF Transcript_21744/g.53225 Transcript_21744/m.53225 type:complete len:386 (+) Transcript_21744:245-1402(+)
MQDPRTSEPGPTEEAPPAFPRFLMRIKGRPLVVALAPLLFLLLLVCRLAVTRPASPNFSQGLSLRQPHRHVCHHRRGWSSHFRRELQQHLILSHGLWRSELPISAGTSSHEAYAFPPYHMESRLRPQGHPGTSVNAEIKNGKFSLESAQNYLLDTRGWKTKEISVKIGDKNQTEYRLVEVTNVDDLLDELMEKGGEALEDDRLPYWIEVWPSALALGKEVLDNPGIGPNVSVIELGCGLGLCSMAAAQKGAEVHQTDYLQEALDMASLAWKLNEKEMPQVAKQPQQHLLDWRHVNSSIQYDVLLASDVAYEERAFEPLINAFSALVKPKGKVFVSEPNRVVARSWTKSLSSLSRMGLHLTRKIEHNVTHNGKVHDITIYELTRAP